MLKLTRRIVHYDAYLVNGNTKFDSSHDRKVPFEFKLEGGRFITHACICILELIGSYWILTGQVIQAWEIAIPAMKVGEIAEIVCDYEYGTFVCFNE